MQTLSNERSRISGYFDLFSKEMEVPKPYIHISGSCSQEKIEKIVCHPLKPNNLEKH
jgi:hypothetical protein